MDFLMPKLSDTMEEGTVLQWLAGDGAEVVKGEPLVEIESDKANMMVDAPESGRLAIIAGVGASLPIGAPIATIGTPFGTAEPTGAPPAPVAAETAAEPSMGIPTADDGTGSAIGLEVYPTAEQGRRVAPQPGRPASSAAPAAAGAHVPASPLARRLAEELGVDIATVHGTGPAGRVVREDVEAAAAGPPPVATSPLPQGAPPAPAPPAPTPAAVAAAPGERVPLSRLQRTIARRMSESKPGAPHFYLQRDVDVTALLALRGELVAASPEGGGPSVNDLIVRAVALAAAERPDAVRAFDGDSLVSPPGVHVGVAVTVPGGLMVPVVRDADTKRVAELAAEVRDLAERCRAGRITPPELEGSVITVTNLGMFGIDRFAAVINPPESAILAIGRAKPTPVALDGVVVIRDVMTVTLSVDHRALYGAEAATFLAGIVDHLERPGSLVL